MTTGQRPARLPHSVVMVTMVLLGLSAPIGPALADRQIAMSSADIENVLAKVKAEHPGASILKIEREREERFGNREVYEVKLLRSDGQVLKLHYDAVTLAPLPLRTDDDDKKRDHHRSRGQW